MKRTTEWLLQRVIDDDTLSEAAKDALTNAMSDGASGNTTSDEPLPAYLKSITVQGFRGIGQTRTLSFSAGPGLVIVAGRNGSGKSSFTEALDMALRGRTSRAEKNKQVWSDNWRNIHQPKPTKVEVQFVVEGLGPLGVGRNWKDDCEDWQESRAWIQLPGKPRSSEDVGLLGWNSALELYRPVLSYDEMGGKLEGRPSELFDVLWSFLGLEELTEIGNRLKARLT
ncbi:MAG: AAA family ATPase, partial [Propionibacteriaceae bacterium]|nr:AAA family ATPase [Propionibacteriaceae bacterium]